MVGFEFDALLSFVAQWELKAGAIGDLLKVLLVALGCSVSL
jgi:hypothetical protein